MKQQMAEWFWRLAVLAAMAWIGWGLQQIHQDLQQPAEEQSTASSQPDSEIADTLDELRQHVEALHQKVDALLIATAQLKKEPK
jgi:uncharacterized protein YlxW (UPF0749 family)